MKKERKREGGKEKREERLRGYKRGLVVGGREGGGEDELGVDEKLAQAQCTPSPRAKENQAKN